MDAFLGKEIDYTVEPAESTKKAPAQEKEAPAQAEIRFGYCTEFIIMLEKEYTPQTEQEFKGFLESIGDSIVVVSDEDVVKVHVQTNDPGKAISRALTYGSLSRFPAAEELPGSYLFSTIAKKVNAFTAANPQAEIIRLGIGDVTQPIAPAVIEALHKAVDEQTTTEGFKGYAPDLGYAFLRETIAKNDYEAYGCDIAADEIFVSDGAKSDSANIQEIFSLDNKIAVCDPVYPVYVDSNVMAGRTGTYDPKSETWHR